VSSLSYAGGFELATMKARSFPAVSLEDGLNSMPHLVSMVVQGNVLIASLK